GGGGKETAAAPPAPQGVGEGGWGVGGRSRTDASRPAAAGSRRAAGRAREEGVMGFEEQVARGGVVQSCQDLMRFQAMFSRHFAHSAARQFGEEGERTLLRALHRYGQYRAGLIRKALDRAAVQLTARAVIEPWDMADCHLSTQTG